MNAQYFKLFCVNLLDSHFNLINHQRINLLKGTLKISIHVDWEIICFIFHFLIFLIKLAYLNLCDVEKLRRRVLCWLSRFLAFKSITQQENQFWLIIDQNVISFAQIKNRLKNKGRLFIRNALSLDIFILTLSLRFFSYLWCVKVFTDKDFLIFAYFNYNSSITWNLNIIWVQIIKYCIIYRAKIVVSSIKFINVLTRVNVPNNSHIYNFKRCTNKSAVNWPINVWNLSFAIHFIFRLDFEQVVFWFIFFLRAQVVFMSALACLCWIIWICGADQVWSWSWFLSLLVNKVIICVGKVYLSVDSKLININICGKTFFIWLCLVHVEAPDYFFWQHVQNQDNSILATNSSKSSLWIEFNNLGVNFLQQ